jgi:hypothetical protein
MATDVSEKFPELFYVEKIVLFGMKLYNEQRNAKVLNLFPIYSALHILYFLLAHLRRQVHDFGSGSSLLGMVSAPALTPLRWSLYNFVLNSFFAHLL